MKTFYELMQEEYTSRERTHTEALKVTNIAETEKCVDPAPQGSSNYIIVEKLSDGLDVSVHKKGNIIKIYDFEARDVSNDYLHLTEELTAISKDNDFIITGTMLKDTFYLSDVVLFANHPMGGKNWKDKRYLIKKLRLSDKVKEIPRLVVTNRQQAISAIEIMSGLKGSLGATLRPLTGASNSIVQYLKEVKK